MHPQNHHFGCSSWVPGIVGSQAYRTTSSACLEKGKDVSDKYIVSCKGEVDGSVARFFYGCGIPINVAKSPFWVDMVRAINEAPKGYEPPSSEKIKTTLLDKEKTKVDQALVFIKQQWPTYGVSVVSNGWMNTKNDEVRKAILDDDFWKNLRTTVTFMRLIWDMICYCDSDRACIGEVYQRIDDMMGSLNVALPDNAELRRVIQYLVAERWDKADIPLFTVAYVLTPHYYSHSWLTSLAPGGKKRKKPHADPGVQKVYLDAVDRLVRDSKEASLVHQQLSHFVSNTGSFSSPQAIKDRDTMSALSWWHLYGASAPELYGLAIKVLSQCVNTCCADRELATCDYIRNVKRNKTNVGRAESLVYVHYNHRLFTRNREDYEGLYQNWDNFLTDDNLEIDVEAIEEREYAKLRGNEIFETQSRPYSPTTSAMSSQTSTQGSSKWQVDETGCSKRPRMR